MKPLTRDYRRADGSVLPGWAPERVQVSVACETPSCRAYGLPRVIATNTNADGILRVICGDCGEWFSKPKIV